MKDVNGTNFGLVIAFLLPGFICLWGLSFSFEGLEPLLGGIKSSDDANLGNFLFSILTSLAIGLLLSAIRWALIDHLMPCMGIEKPPFNYRALAKPDNREAFDRIVENHYRYYQYYSNSFVAIVIALVTYCFQKEPPVWWIWLCLLGVSVALILGCRDAMSRYCTGAKAILSETE